MRTPPLGFIHAPWWEVLSAELRAEKLTRQAWIAEVAKRLGLVIHEEDSDAASQAQH